MPRKRSPHPGIVLRPAREGHGASIRWRDPVTGRQHDKAVPPGLQGAELSRWLLQRSHELTARKLAVGVSDPGIANVAIETCITVYFAAATRWLKPSTVAMYKLSTELFQQWCAEAKVRTGDDITTQKLRGFRTWLAARPKRSLVSADRDLSTISAVLNYGRKEGLYPRLTSDGIKDGLQRYRPKTERKDFLRPAQCAALLEAAMAHDEAPAVTGRKRLGAIAPLVATLLLSGMRLDEALQLSWQAIDLDPQDPAIRLAGKATKTGEARDVDLTVSPALYALLRTLKIGRGKGKIFDFTADAWREGVERMIKKHEAPTFTAHALRRTTGTVLACAPGIFGAASVYMAAKQLGHSVEVAQKHYLGRLKVPKDATTIEAALRVADLIKRVQVKALVRAGKSAKAIEREQRDSEAAALKMTRLVRVAVQAN